MPIAHMPASRTAQLRSRWGWLVLFGVLAIGVLNPLGCIIHCLNRPAHEPVASGISWFLCHELGLVTTNVSFADLPIDTSFKAPRTASPFEQYVLALTLTLALVYPALRVQQRTHVSHRLLIDPPLVPPPQHA